MANNAFDISGPSSFVRDKRFIATKRTGRSMSQACTDAVAAKEKRTGKSPGTIRGISVLADQQIDTRRRK